MNQDPTDGGGFQVNRGGPIQTADDLTAAIYARTSSPQQEHGYSIDEQVRQCWKRCERLEWTVSHVFRDKAVSGEDTDREMFQKLLTRAESGWLDVIVVWKLDRFSRSLMHAVQLEQQLRDWDVGLHSVTQHIDTTTPTGRFNFRNIASASELERDWIRQRTQMGLRALAEDRKWPNDTPPLGYRKTENGQLEIHQKEAELVRYIFERYIELRSMPELADELSSRTAIVDRDLEWTPYKVSKILKNDLYVGHYTVAEVDKYVEEYQILDDETFERAKKVRTRFQRDAGATRPEMPSDRKKHRIQNVTEQYSTFLESKVERE